MSASWIGPTQRQIRWPPDTTVGLLRRGGRAADCRRLESARGETLRGFKSLPRREAVLRIWEEGWASAHPDGSLPRREAVSWDMRQRMVVMMGSTAVLVVIDIVVVVFLSILAGALAPRWPTRWLQSDPPPLRLMSWETPAAYRRLGVPALARRLPELGSLFGGESKSSLPGFATEELKRYLVEVRRGEWVHWISVAVPLLLFAFNPWWLALVFTVAVALGNLPFILILRNNRRRIGAIIDRDESST